METSIAKAHSRRLLREIVRFPDEIWKLAGVKDVLEKKSVAAKNRYLKKLAKSNIAQFTNKLCLGTKKGTYFCGTYLSQGTYNPHL